jgi:hypothetical protein
VVNDQVEEAVDQVLAIIEKTAPQEARENPDD